MALEAQEPEKLSFPKLLGGAISALGGAISGLGGAISDFGRSYLGSREELTACFGGAK